MITIETTLTDIAKALDVPVYTTHEIIRRLFLTSQPIPLPEKFKYIADVGSGDYTSLTPEYLTIFRTLNSDSNVLDVASLLVYITEAVKSVMDLSTWKEYTGPEAPAPTGEPWEPKWVRHYPLPGKYAVYPGSE